MQYSKWIKKNVLNNEVDCINIDIVMFCLNTLLNIKLYAVTR